MKAKKKPDFDVINDKLAEARKFLSELRQHNRLQGRPERPSPDNFQYNLSAFLTAARSISELIERTVKQNWKNDLTEPEKALHQWFRSTRKQSVHHGRIETIREAKEVPVRFDPSAYYHRPPHNFSFSQSMFGEAYTYAETYYFRFCGKKREVVELCEEYIALLSRVVANLANG